MKYRHEYKYLCNNLENTLIKERIKSFLKKDMHANEEGYYTVRSLYFDTLYNTLYYENIDGKDQRDKYRIRIYNANSEKITLEKKSKINGKTLKYSYPITREICESLMMNIPISLTKDMDEVLLKLLSEMQVRNLRPVVIVEYLRYPFVEKNGNVRVTFDENIRSSNEVRKFLDKILVTRPILATGMSILEVKWDDFLPEYIKSQLQIHTLQWSNFSKFVQCRKFNYYGGIKT